MTQHVHCKLCGYSIDSQFFHSTFEAVVIVNTNDGFQLHVHERCLLRLTSAVPCLEWRINAETFKLLSEKIHAPRA